MSKTKFRRFGNPDFLRKIKPETLQKLLLRFAPFFEKQGIDLVGDVLSPGQFDRLSALFVSPPSTCPGPLLDAVDMLEMLTSRPGLAELREVLGPLVKKVHEKDDGAGDIALKIWLLDQHAIERIYTKFSIDRGRTMKSYRPDPDRKPVAPDRERCAAMKKELEFCCAELFDTPVCDVMAFEEADGWALLIRHGEYVRRYGIIDDNNRYDTKALRPLKHDVGFIDMKSGEVLLSGRSDEVRNTYRHVISKHLFGEPTLLKPSRRFTLEPLRGGRESLLCPDLDLVTTSMLRELHLRRIGTTRTTIHRADDVFEEIEERGYDYLRDFDLVKARFTIRIRAQRKAPSLLVSPEDDTLKGDIHHPVARPWMEACGFNNANEEVLAVN
jgi:hypothetical protein